MNTTLLKEACDVTLELLEAIWEEIQSNNLEDNKYIIKFLEKLSSYSVRN